MTERAPRWGLPDVVVGFVVGQVASAMAFAAMASSKDVSMADLSTDDLSIGEIGLLQLPLWLGLLGVPLVATRLRGNGPVRDLGWRMETRDAPVGFLLGVACQLVLVPLVSLPFVWLTDNDYDELSRPAEDLADKATGLGILVLVLVVVVAAPLAEEVFYRGLLQRSLLRRLPAWPAMIVTSVVFGASHFQALQFPALAAFGLLLSVIARRTGRLGMNTWAHVGFNATTVVILLAT